MTEIGEVGVGKRRSREEIKRLVREFESIRLVNSTAGGGSEFGRSVSGCPGGGRKFGDSTDWKITQSRQDGTQIAADRDFESPTGFDHRNDRSYPRPGLFTSDVMS